MSLAFAKGYCDLNIPIDSDVSPLNLVKRAISFGYETLALNIRVHQKELIRKKSLQKHEAKKAKTENVVEGMYDFPEPPKIELSEQDYPDLALSGKKPVILYRLTIRFFNNDFLPFVSNSGTVKKYDIIAVHPESNLAMVNLNKSGFTADLICFDPDSVKDVKWSRKLYNECVRDKNMFFEIPYSPCIRDSTARRRIIAQSHNYHAVGKSKAIIISSEALTPLELRGPHDVANLGFIFGLNEQQGKNAVKQNPIELVQSASGRRLGPYRALVQKLEDLPQSESWKIPDELSESDSDSGESESESGESSDSDKNEPSPGTSGTSGNGFIGFSVAS